MTVCVEGRYPFDAENLLSPQLNVVLKFTTCDPGYLTAAPESIAKKAILATKLGGRLPILGFHFHHVLFFECSPANFSIYYSFKIIMIEIWKCDSR